MNKWQYKTQEATFKFFLVPIIFLLGIYVVSIMIQVFTGINDFFRWMLFSIGLFTYIIYYFKKNLTKINW